MSEGEPRRDLTDAIVSEVLRAYDQQLVDEAAAAGEDLGEVAAAMRARFLGRLAAARARGAGSPDSFTLADIEAESAAGYEQALACPRTIGRYPILRRLGAGGMGVVYEAYDEMLDRPLAIKVLHDDVWDAAGRRRERLLREAQAMARVTHPNVATVHEVGIAGGQLFLAMEFVSGPTLNGWLAKERRTWQEIVAVFRQIADGIGAIHDAGLVHRDIKPSNVIVGDDGRVRVLDLGLVAVGVTELFETDESALRSSSSFNRMTALTMTGERVGTPAYMAREQFLGREPTPASDVFSFSVALFEALYGIHPFGMGSFHDLQVAVVDGRLRPRPSATMVPAWVHAQVVRGLAADPEDRPASMQILSRELANDPRRVHRRWIAIVGATALAVTIGLLVANESDPEQLPTCDGGQASIAGVWSEERAAEVRAAMIASERSYAPALAKRITESLDDYADDWAAAHDRTCSEHARGDHSDALLDARMACLDRRRHAFVETVEILAHADAEVVEHAGWMVGKLPRLEACDDLSRFVDHESPVRSPEFAALIGDLESRLVRAEALANAGRIAESMALAGEVADEAEALEQPALVVEALLGQARAAILNFDRPATGVALDRALEISIIHGLHAPAAEAMIRRLYVRGLDVGGSAAALADVPIAEAMLERAGGDPELQVLLFNNQGAIHAAAGDREAARQAFGRALALAERLYGAEHLEVGVALGNLGMMTSDPATRSSLHQRMIANYEQRLGPDHPRTLNARLVAAFHTDDPELAGAALALLCPDFRAIGELEVAGECELERGRIAFAHGRLDVARRAFELAREQFGKGDRRVLLDAYLCIDVNTDVQPAIAALRQSIARPEAGLSDDWWLRLEQAERRFVLARLLVQSGEPALAELDQADRDLEFVADHAQPFQRDRLRDLLHETRKRAEP